jgi:hypothetical protein
VHHGVATGDGAAEGFDLQQVAGYGFGRDAGQVLELAGWTDQEA